MSSGPNVAPIADLHVLRASAPEQATRWQKYVEEHPQANGYHRWGWKSVVENSFGWRTFYLMLEDAGRVRGVLPLVWQSSRIFGSFLTSMPFFNYGGVLADDEACERRLVDEAIAVAKEVSASHIELRHMRQHNLGLATKQSKLTLIREIPRLDDEMWKSLDTKMRTKVRRTLQDVTVEAHGAEALGDFYEIFVHNMRDLGTPVYAQNFFAEILREFPREVFITVARHKGQAVASSFLVGFRDTLEVPWSSSLREALSLRPNMALYWKNMRVAAENGYRFFDFGRSSPGSGTHEFKKQWGPKEVPLYWDYWMAGGGELPELNPRNRKYRLAIALWQRLPLGLTKLIGPRIVRCLP